MNIKQLETNLITWSQAYYDGTPIVSDAVFDFYLEQLRELDPTNSILFRTGHGYIPKTSHLTKVDHSFFCGSLGKIKDVDSTIWSNEPFIVTPKFDGGSVVAYYQNGTLSVVLSRGNGVVGLDITRNVIHTIPKQIHNKEITAVRGELVVSYETAKKLGASHPRNKAIGLSQSINVNQEELQELHIVWYDLPEFLGTKIKIMETLKEEGFVVPYYRICNSWVDYKQFANKHDKTTTIIPSISGTFPIDGLVLTKCDNSSSIAYKFANEIAESVVKDIIWQLSRTGRYIPVLNVESVFLSGANISRVTANNLDWLTQWKAGIGSTINIIRSNEIIPTLIGVINDSTEYNMPTHCEACGTLLTIHGKDLMCENQNCSAKNQATISMILNHFKSDGIGNTIIDDIISIHYLTTIKDVGEWAHYVELEDLKTNFGSVTSTKIKLLADEICNRKITFSDIFTMANIPSVSSSTIEKLITNVSMTEFIDVFENDNRAIIRSNKWIDCFPTYKQPDNIELYFDRLVELYILFSNQIVEIKQKNQPIMMTYALTGTLSKTRNEIVKEFTEYGCKFVDVNKADVLIAPGPSTSAKYKLAISRGIKIMTEDEFRKFLNKITFPYKFI